MKVEAKVKATKNIVCRYDVIRCIELVVDLDHLIPIKQFRALRRRLMRREKGRFFVDVQLIPELEQAGLGQIVATVSPCVADYKQVEVFGSFQREVQKLTNHLYCFDCSLLHIPPPRPSKPPSRPKPPTRRKSPVFLIKAT